MTLLRKSGTFGPARRSISCRTVDCSREAGTGPPHRRVSKLIMRDGRWSRILRPYSRGAAQGGIWAPLVAGNLPLTVSKPYARHLSTAQAFLVGKIRARPPHPGSGGHHAWRARLQPRVECTTWDGSPSCYKRPRAIYRKYRAMRRDHGNWFGVREQSHPGGAHSR